MNLWPHERKKHVSFLVVKINESKVSTFPESWNEAMAMTSWKFQCPSQQHCAFAPCKVKRPPEQATVAGTVTERHTSQVPGILASSEAKLVLHMAGPKP